MQPADPHALRCAIALLRVPCLGPRARSRLVEAFGSAAAALEADAGALHEAGVPPAAIPHLRRPSWSAVDHDMASLAGTGTRAIVLDDPAYPPLLRAIGDPPVVLFVRGSTAALRRPQVAVVGSRRCSRPGRDFAARLAGELCAAGLAVTSGLASGIDTAAHRGALAAEGCTLAVLGCGIDRVYPRANAVLSERIGERGAVVSEFGPGAPPRAGHFPQRNRIISGLSLGVVVVEAARRSGSLITARLAAEQGREVFAVPGPVHSPFSGGCHRLLRDGACLVEGAADVLAELAGWPAVDVSVLESTEWRSRRLGEEAPEGVSDLSDAERCLLDAVSFDAVSIDFLVDATGLTAQEVSSILFALEMRGYVSSAAGGLYTRAGARG